MTVKTDFPIRTLYDTANSKFQNDTNRVLKCQQD